MEKNKPKSRKVSTMIDLHSIGPKVNTAQEEKKLIKIHEFYHEPCQGVRMISLSKTYHRSAISTAKTEIHALKNVYLEISEGELLCIMGHNGAGKSTLINVLSGFTSATSGNARVYDKTLENDL